MQVPRATRLSVSRTCWPGLTSASGSRAGIAWCAASAASSAASAVWTSVLMVLIISLVSTTEVPGCGEWAASSAASLAVSVRCSARLAFSTSR